MDEQPQPLDPSSPDYKAEFEARLAQEGTGPLLGKETFPKVVKVSRKLIKNDDYSVKQIYLHALSAYTAEPSNLQTIAPTSEGKTYPIVNILRHYPKEDVWFLGGLSPTAIQHDKGHLVDKDTGEDKEEALSDLYKRLDLAEEIEDTKERRKAQREIKGLIRGLLKNCIKEVNLEGKIICFLDKPNPKTLDMLKPILSHDKYETYYKITDRKGRQGLAAQTIKIKGWPCVLVASTRVAAFKDTWEEIVSRFDTISPNMSKAKYRAAVELTAMRKGLPNGVLTEQLGLDEFEQVRTITKAIKDELIKIREQNSTPREFTPNIFWVPFYEKLGEDLPADVGRHMRDSTRFFTILQMHAAANIFNRPRVVVDRKPSIIVTRRDYDAAKELYFSGEKAESLLTGIPERVLQWFDKVFNPCWEKVKKDWKETVEEVQQELSDDTEKATDLGKDPVVWITTSQLTDKTADVWIRPLTTDSIRKNYLDELLRAGYIDAQDHPTDKRAKHYKPIIDKDAREKGNLHDSDMFSLDSLREAYNELEKIKDWEHGVCIQDYNGRPLNVEQLYEKYFTEKHGADSFIYSEELQPPDPETAPKIAESDNLPQNPVNSREGDE